jgi:asparagine synthase (glutamine-hydrolysing)
MRAALQGVVPGEILERRRKAYLLAGPLRDIRELAPRISEAVTTSFLVANGYVERDALERSLANITRGETTQGWGFILRFAWLETWLKHRAQTKIAREETQIPVGAQTATERVPVS